MREEVATLAAERERMRIARDLHDLLGHSLTTVTVKAALAARLFDQDPCVRARRSPRSKCSRAKASPTCARPLPATARCGWRPNSRLPARFSKRPASTPSCPASSRACHREVGGLFGWVVREGVTNVVRHSKATSVRITLDATGIEIVDDGSGCARKAGEVATTHPGNGLAGTRRTSRRARRPIGRRPVDGSASGFRLRVEVPAAWRCPVIRV